VGPPPNQENTVNNPREIFKNALSRRTFLAGAGSAAAATLVMGCSDDGTATLPSVNTYTDADILNFALNLEYLEAEFYLRAATGSGLSSTDAGTGAGTVTGGAKITGLTTAQQNVLNEIAYDEQEHVRFLRSALGSAAVPRPNIDLNAGFTGAVTAANSLSSTLPAIPTAFNPFGTFDQFLVGAFVFEDVGVTAYNGAAPLISTAGITAGYLAAAAGILAVEAYHAAYVRTTLTANAINQGSTAYPYPLYANRVSALRAALGGGNETMLSGFQASAATVANVTGSTIVAADTTNAIAFHRNTDQVLHIVYGAFSTTAGSTTPSAGVAQGGFFPNGLNGNIKVTQS
jgi:Ferritin-like domain